MHDARYDSEGTASGDKHYQLMALPLSDYQANVLQAAIYTSSSLSLIGILYVILHFCWLQWFASGERRRRRPQMEFTAKLVLVLSLFDLATILARIVGRAVIHDRLLCDLQASVLYATGLGSCLWVCCMAFNLYRWIVGGESDAKRQSRFSLFLAISIIPCIGFVIYHVATNRYGDATFYCWFKEGRIVLLHFYLFYVLMVVFIIVLHALIRNNMKRRVAWHDTVEADTSSALIRRKSLLYIVVFIVHRAPMMFYRIFETMGIQSFMFGLVAQIILDLDGLSNSIVYGGLCRREPFQHEDELPRARTFPADSVSSPTESVDDFFAKKRITVFDDLDVTMGTALMNATSSTMSSSMNTMTLSRSSNLFSSMEEVMMRSSILNCLLPQHDRASRKRSADKNKKKKRPQTLPLFVSTFNMGEQNVNEAELPDWIPLGYQIYVIGVQECMDLSDLQTKIHQYLVVGSQCKFVYYSREIGKRATALGYHGYIALTVFVREDAVLDGRFQMPYRPNTNKSAQEVYRGKSLLVFGRASNKGAVGMSFRYENTSFAFATCHLASDSSSNRLSKRKKSRDCKAAPSKFERRNQDAMEILQQLYLDDEDYGFGFPLLHHHSFILGDFNYRMTRQVASPQEIFESLIRTSEANALSAEDGDTSSSTLPGTPQSEVGLTPTTSCAFQECSTPKKIETSKSLDLVSLLEEHDELHALRNSNQLFYGFNEPKIHFYPTFRRVRGQKLNPSDPNSFLSNFTLITSKGGHRVPSYTDRVLYSSLPGSQNMVECLSYNSCESITTSDHKPVYSIFQVTLNEAVCSSSRSLPDESVWTNSGGGNLNILNSNTVTTGRMKDVPGTCEMRLKIDFKSIHWMDAIDCQPGSTLFDRVEDIEFGFLFPIPCEDVFSQQRKLHEVAEHLTRGDSGSVDLDFASTVTPTSNFHTIKWNNFVEGGLRYNTMAQPSSKKHVVVQIRAQSRGRTLSRTSSATAVLGSPFAPPGGAGFSSQRGRKENLSGLSGTGGGGSSAGSRSIGSDMSSSTSISAMMSTGSDQILGQGTFCVDATGRKRDTVISLTVGGKLTGRLQLQVALQVRRHPR